MYIGARKAFNWVVQMTLHQGDHVGRIFALWAIVCFGLCFENYRSSAKIWPTLPTIPTMYVLVLTKYGLSFLGDFFSNASGHPARHVGITNLTFLVPDFHVGYVVGGRLVLLQ
jgi:hypothetical protein